MSLKKMYVKLNSTSGKAVYRPQIPCRLTQTRSRSAQLFSMLFALSAVLYVNEASAQCSAQATLQKRLLLYKAPSAAMPPTIITSVAAVPVWRTITLGAISNKLSLRKALEAADCGIEDLANNILARPSFTLSATKAKVDLVILSASELGLRGETALLVDIYARAQKLGFRLAAAEVGPQLRLQYFDQPIGEFLNVAMKPIKTQRGEPIIFVLVNGGAGLVILSQNGSINAELPVASRFVFVRPVTVAAVQKK